MMSAWRRDKEKIMRRRSMICASLRMCLLLPRQHLGSSALSTGCCWGVRQSYFHRGGIHYQTTHISHQRCALSYSFFHHRTSRKNSVSGHSDNESRIKLDTFGFLGALLLQSCLVALLVVAWEDVTCTFTLPSRHRTSLQKTSWGAYTVKGLGFGREDRLMLPYQDGFTDMIPSYNEIMLQHRKDRVPRWRTTSIDQSTIEQAAHTLLECLSVVKNLQAQASDYQWSEIRKALQATPLTDLEPAASVLRGIVDLPLIREESRQYGVIGFDWGSCAWRHCGALADAQEALDELEHLLGLLEPFEAIFCLDVAERSLRDMLTVVPWDQMNPNDARDWKEWPQYEPLASPRLSSEGDLDGIDDEYLRVLKELRIE